ncbi:MAG: outer membrane lipoprotein chaperone LolA [Proteobacteria bacterium]|nr:outer membrane lipoprotein chaperone LolA [Pseudomonadota bacterium]
MKTIKSFLAIVLFVSSCGYSMAAGNSGISSLNHFYKNVKTFSANFTQIVMDESLTTLQESTGRLWIKRPGRFRWDYNEPFKQYIIADGNKIWLYDVELKQASFREMDGALGHTPAFLLGGSGSLKKNFKLKSLGKQGKLHWVQMKPKKSDGGFEDIRIGFEKGKIRMLEMVDSFGQTTRITLSKNRENRKIKTKLFQFKPPKGVEVVGTPGG